MKIGIDVDDTITNTWATYIPEFHKVFNVPISKLKKSKPYYQPVKDRMSLEEYFIKVKPIYTECTPKVKARRGAQKYINKLYDSGYEIYFITARGVGYNDEYNQIMAEMTKEFLKKNNIKYNRIITYAKNKGEICKKEGIDVLVDDSIKHCTYAKELGIDTILYETNYNKDDTTFRHASSWKKVYEYIKDR